MLLAKNHFILSNVVQFDTIFNSSKKVFEITTHTIYIYPHPLTLRIHIISHFLY